MRKYWTVNGVDKLDLTMSASIQNDFNDVWSNANPKLHQCLSFGPYILVKHDSTPDKSTVSVKSNSKNKMDPIETFPKELQKAMVQFREEFNLNKRNLETMRKSFQEEDFRQLNMAQKLKSIEEMALEMNKTSNQDKITTHFEKKYLSFSACLNDDLLALPKEKEIISTLNFQFC